MSRVTPRNVPTHRSLKFVSLDIFKYTQQDATLQLSVKLCRRSRRYILTDFLK